MAWGRVQNVGRGALFVPARRVSDSKRDCQVTLTLSALLPAVAWGHLDFDFIEFLRKSDLNYVPARQVGHNGRASPHPLVVLVQGKEGL